MIFCLQQPLCLEAVIGTEALKQCHVNDLTALTDDVLSVGPDCAMCGGGLFPCVFQQQQQQYHHSACTLC